MVGEGLSERLDVFEEGCDGFLKRKRFAFCVETRDLKAAVFGVEFEALAFLRLSLPRGFLRRRREAACRYHAIR